MSTTPNRLLSAQQHDILERAVLADRLRTSDLDDETTCTEMWRAGFLRVNGEPGYQVTLLGIEVLRRDAATLPAVASAQQARAREVELQC